MLMCTLGAKNEDATLKLMTSLRDYVRDGSGTNCDVSREVGLAVCEAFEQADKEPINREKSHERKGANDRPTHGEGLSITRG
ncbi:Tetratricopeptide repeat protein 38 [Desmophyllum pertusum]|uniref:Tetratricopeptide repeat protein 38 n=1 Tax=Desmophyllum pertusum TaxID=174260 RepID=A0A9W9ZXM5_9CNID|nr:Tetratricopeptide repeat protein 38 [Desmophyllum pertusum]